MRVVLAVAVVMKCLFCLNTIPRLPQYGRCLLLAFETNVGLSLVCILCVTNFSGSCFSLRFHPMFRGAKSERLCNFHYQTNKLSIPCFADGSSDHKPVDTNACLLMATVQPLTIFTLILEPTS